MEKPDMVDTSVEVTQDLVREIAMNLGAGKNLTEALIDKMWWSPPGGGILHKSARNRDCVVALVERELSGIWRRGPLI